MITNLYKLIFPDGKAFKLGEDRLSWARIFAAEKLRETGAAWVDLYEKSLLFDSDYYRVERIYNEAKI